MKMETPSRPRQGLPAWGIAASVGIALVAASAIVVRSAGGPSPRFLSGASAEGVVSADGPDADPVAIDDEPVAPPRARPTAILASLPAKEVAPAVPAKRDDAGAAIARAKAAIAECRARYRALHDYACVFHKRERIDGKLTRPHVMNMRVRTEPYGVYIKFVAPDPGREAIYQPAKHNGKIVYHDIGIGRLIAGTMLLDPRGTLAMDENRHPISDAGIGNLIEMVRDRWESELDPAESVVTIHEHARVADRACTMIEASHPRVSRSYSFHKVKVYIDHELGLPIRFEAYDWPKSAGAEPELVEEYTYSDLKTDVGVGDVDFDAANPHYAFGRF
ncbi:MAG TPA: DUF1571 domain-containing protein [Isosphaeraceae bacterium]